MANTRELEILLTLKDQVSGELSKLQKGIKGMEPVFKGMAVAGTAAFAGIAAFAKSSIDAANEAAEVQAQLGAVLKSTGGAAGVTADAAIELSKALQRQSTFGDEAVLSAENMLLTFTNIGKTVFPDATQTVLDMSVALGQDLQSSAIQVGKALNDPILGVTALRRVGVNFTEQQQDQIKVMVESGKTMEAQRFILEELGKEFGGSASAQTQTFSGQIKMMKEQIGDAQEEIGNALIPVLANLLTAIAPVVTKFGEWAAANPEQVKGLILWGGAISGIIAVLGFLGLALPGIITGIGGVATAAMFLYSNPVLLGMAAFAATFIAIEMAAIRARDAIDGAKAAAAQGVSTAQKLVDERNKNPNATQAQKDYAQQLLTESLRNNYETQKLNIGSGFTDTIKNIFTPKSAAGDQYRSVVPAGQQYNFTFQGSTYDRPSLINDVTKALNRPASLKLNAGT